MTGSATICVTPIGPCEEKTPWQMVTITRADGSQYLVAVDADRSVQYGEWDEDLPTLTPLEAARWRQPSRR